MVAYPQQNGGYKTREFKNTAKGVHEFIHTLGTDDHCVMEATGNYSYLLLYLLNHANITTSMENALKVKNFARTMLSVTKTDKADAQLLSLYGERMRPAPFKLPSESSFYSSRNVLLSGNSKSNSMPLTTQKVIISPA